MKKLEKLPFAKIVKKISIYIFILCVGGAVGLGAYTFQQQFEIRTIELLSPPRSKVLKTSMLHGANLLFVSEEELVKELTAANPLATGITITKQFPSTIRISYEYQIPVIVLSVDQNGYFILSRDGIIVGKTRQADEVDEYPIIYSYQLLRYLSYQVGDALEYSDIQAAISYFEKARSLGISVERIDIEGIDMIVLKTTQQSYIFSTQQDQELQEYQFETVLKRISAEGLDYISVDFRFDKPVIRLY